MYKGLRGEDIMNDDKFFKVDEEGIYDNMTPLVGYTTI